MAPIVLVAVLAISKRWTFDDGFIYFRSVDQILAGNGPVFNAGERVESFTSPVWLALLTVGDIVSPLRLEYTAAMLSIGCTAVGMWLATLGSARLANSDRTTSDSIRVPLGSVIFAALWPVWVWATSGLEIGLTYAWLGACLLRARSVGGRIASAATACSVTCPARSRMARPARAGVVEHRLRRRCRGHYPD